MVTAAIGNGGWYGQGSPFPGGTQGLCAVVGLWSARLYTNHRSATLSLWALEEEFIHAASVPHL